MQIVDLTDPEDQTQFSDATLEFLFTNYAIDVVYDSVAGVIQLPVANDEPTPAIFISTSAELSKKVVRWTAERAGQWPSIPSIDTGNTNEVYLSKRVVPAAPELQPDNANYIYRVSGEYYYGLKDATVETSSLSVAAMPNLKASFTENTMPSTVYKQNIIGTG